MDLRKLLNIIRKDMINKDLKKRIIEISYSRKLAHLGSCLTSVDIIDEIFKIKKPDEKFVLSSGHAGLALYVVLEKYLGLNAEEIFEHHGVHPDRCVKCHIDCSSGSLGNGLPIAVGMALADRSKNVYCLISDGECSEGSIWEALRIIEEQKLYNIRIIVNANGWGAYKEIDIAKLFDRLNSVLKGKVSFFLASSIISSWDNFNWSLRNEDTLVWVAHTSSEYFPFLKGQKGHYIAMNQEQYGEALGILK